jgi:prepilin-type N-terminal cleavage/methylation domain-containing protein
MSRSRTRGMTIVELMIVVVIIGILAAISVVSYRRYIARARMSEVTAMLAEFAAKEMLYYQDAGLFLEAHNAVAANAISVNENANEFFPTDPSNYFDSVRTPTTLGTLPTSWRLLGIRPRWPQLYCTYMVNTGAAGSAATGTIGATLWTSTPQVPWFYAMGACNLQGEAGWPNNVTVMTLTHDSPAIRTKDEVP